MQPRPPQCRRSRCLPVVGQPPRARSACVCTPPLRPLPLLPLLLLAAAAALLRPVGGVTTTTSSSSDAGGGGAAAPGRAGGGVCGVRAPACDPLRVTAPSDATLAGTYAITGCARGRPVYTRVRGSAGAAANPPPRVLAWAGAGDYEGWAFAPNVSAAAAAPLLRANTAYLAGGFQPQAAWARPEWLVAPAAPAHAVWLGAPDVSVACADNAAADTATAALPLSPSRGCTGAERGACPLVVSASSDDPLSKFAGTYSLSACLGGRPLYTRPASSPGGAEMHIAFLVRAGGVWAVTASPGNSSAPPAAALLPNPAFWAPGASGGRPEVVAVSYNSYAHDVWAWSAWPAPAGGARLDTSRAALRALPVLPSPSFMVLCATSAFVTSPPPAPPGAPAPPQPPQPPPDAAAAARRGRAVAAAAGTCVGVAGVLLGAAGATALHRRREARLQRERAAEDAAALQAKQHLRSVAIDMTAGHNDGEDGDDAYSDGDDDDDFDDTSDPSSSARGGGAPPPWWDALRTRSSDVVLGALLGDGGFASVYEGTWRASPVAVKVLHRLSEHKPGGGGGGGAAGRRAARATAAAALAREVLLLSRIRHPNVLSVYGYALKPPMLLLELGARGSLAALLRGAGAGAVGWRERCRLAHGVACGLAFLHAPEPPIVHLDVKCENVVLDEGLTPKVSDFGMSALLLHIRGGAAAADGAPAGSPAAASSDSSSASGGASAAGSSSVSYRLRARGCGTPLYLAPELETTAAGEELTLPLAVDAYCFGAAVLHALAHGGTAARVGALVTPLYCSHQQHDDTQPQPQPQPLQALQPLQPQPPPAADSSAADGAAVPLEQVPAPTFSDKPLPWGRIQILVARSLAGWQPEMAPRVPLPLADAIRRCCAVDPAARPSMEALREEMQALMAVADEW
jgi:serine/threonine protein kinase